MEGKLEADRDEYEPTDSEQEYNEDEREIMENYRKERKKRAQQKQEKSNEVMLFSDNSDDEDDDVAELMRDSDIEGAGDDDDNDLPDTMNWGNKKSAYYNTDFVDPDYSSYNVEEEDMALAEEEEAKKIQLRLAKQMREADFELDDMKLPAADESDEEKAAADGKIKVTADLTGLDARERLQLLQKDSPEFIGLTQDFQQHLAELQQLLAPVLNYVRNHQVPQVPALQYASLYQNVLLTYCSNVSFYLLLKAKRSSVKFHPVVKRLVQLRQLKQQLEPRYESFIKPQLEALLERIQDGDAFTVLDVAQRKAKLEILKQYEKPAEKKKLPAELEPEEPKGTDDDDDDEAGEDGEEAEAGELDEEEQARRGITYQIAKNKGLMPYRKKELRNPRVKHRGKYRKALIRRKGAVRTVRKELQRYGGEVSGIKSTVTKSVKFKT